MDGPLSMRSRTSSLALRVGICAFLLSTGVALVPASAQASPLTILSFSVRPNHIDDGQNSIFNVTVSGGVAPYSYNWSGLPQSQDWAPCIPANVSRLSCNVGVPGTFWIGVNVTDSAGQIVAGGPVELTVAEPIGYDARATPHEGTAPLIVTFTDSGIGGTPPYTFSWIFGDGGHADVANTTHTYTVAGTYLVYGCMGDSLQRPGCEGIYIRAVAPRAPLTVTLTAQPAAVTVLERTFLNATASGGQPYWSYTWSALPPGCFSENVSILSCVPTAAGTYTVRVTVSDSLGHSASTTVTIQVSPLTVPADQTMLLWVLLDAVIVVGLGLVALAFAFWRTRRPPGRA